MYECKTPVFLSDIQHTSMSKNLNKIPKYKISRKSFYLEWPSSTQKEKHDKANSLFSQLLCDVSREQQCSFLLHSGDQAQANIKFNEKLT
jgi:hypothetical protein